MLTMTDCAVADNRVQARYELDAAVADSGYTKMAAWAMKWGRALVEFAENAPTDDEENEAIQKAYSETNEIGAERDDLQSAVRVAIDKLERLLDDGVIDEKHDAYSVIDGLIATLQDA